MGEDFEVVLKQKRKLVWPEINKYLESPLTLSGKLKISSKYFPLIKFHRQLFSEYPQRMGKYIRPTLVLLTAQAMGFPQKKALKTAAAMQVSEDWILNHDDIEDDSLERRGKPALHRLYGQELAINAGDALHILMWRMLWDNRKVVGERKAVLIAQEFFQMLMRTTLGQTAEIKWTKENKQNLTDRDIFFILDGKTTYYTIAGPMRLGAILAGATKKQLEAIYEFGQPLGRCFQIIDDLLDLTSDFRGLKKQVGNDIYEGKRTLMLRHLFQTIRGQDRKKLILIMAKNREQKTSAEVKWVIKKMKEFGSLEYGRLTARRLVHQAKKTFAQKLPFLSRQPARVQLESAIDFILKRDY
jgi:geranylgeranyl diphosphate synthase type II